MRDFKKERGFGSRISSLFLLCFWTVLAVGVAIFGLQAAWSMYGKFMIASHENATAQKELQNLEDRYARMSAAVENFSTERGIEEEVRERFGVAKEGEGEIRIVRSATTTAKTGTTNPWFEAFQALLPW